MTYQQRYCAYIDILGFKELVNRLAAGGTPFEFLKELLSKLHNPWNNLGGMRTDADFRVQSMSDAVVISTTPTAWGLVKILHAISDLTRDLLMQGYFIRGAIAKGGLYHDDKMVFGDALVAAFKLEQEIVRFPRIMVSSEIFNEARADEEFGATMYTSILKGDDGPYHAHTLEPLAKFLQGAQHSKDAEAVKLELEQWVEIQKKIEQRFAEAADTPRNYEKVKWFVNYWNQTVDPVAAQFILHINGPGLPYYFETPPDNRIPPY